MKGAAISQKNHPTEKGSSRDHLYWLKLLILALFIGAMSVIAWLNGVEAWFDLHRITVVIQGLGLLAPIIYILFRVTGVILMLPSLPLDAAAGAVFGPFLGAVYSIIGTEAGAIISFLIARRLGREAVTRWLRRDIVFCDLCAERQLVYVIFLARLLPMVSFDLVSYGAGLTHLSIRGFALATLLGMIPLTFVVSYSGRSFFSAPGFSLLLGALVVVLFFSVPIWIKRRNPWGLYDRMMREFRLK